jgi:signal transduction histidine kinase
VAALVTTLEVALRRPREPAELRATLATCLAEARVLRRLVTGLLEQARSESFGPNPECDEPFDAAVLLRSCATAAATLAAERGVRVTCEVPPSLDAVTQAGRLRGIVTNLLSNAVEYNRPGGTVTLSAHAAGGVLELAVSDTGNGIDPSDLPHVFEPFHRGRAPVAAPGEPHLGLGLYLVRSHVDALAGEVGVESEPGRGTTFRVRLPNVLAPARASIDAMTSEGARTEARPVGDGGWTAESAS